MADVIKPDSPRAVRELQNMGIRVVMLTGDNQRTADAIGKQAGVDEVIAGVLPDGKESVIRDLMRQGRVAMVGDGINDAPALTRADTGIAIGAGTDVAIDAADVVLMKSRLSDVPAAIRLSRATLRNIHENLFWAFFYNSIGIPLAAGVFVPLGLTLNPMFGAAAMSLSSVCVVSNALRLNLFNMHDGRKDKKIRHTPRKEAPQNTACTVPCPVPPAPAEKRRGKDDGDRGHDVRTLRAHRSEGAGGSARRGAGHRRRPGRHGGHPHAARHPGGSPVQGGGGGRVSAPRHAVTAACLTIQGAGTPPVPPQPTRTRRIVFL